MTVLDLILQIISQFGLVGIDKLRELTTECDEFEKSSGSASTNKFKVMFHKVHYGEYGLGVRLVIPIVYFFLRSELKGIETAEKGDILV